MTMEYALLMLVLVGLVVEARCTPFTDDRTTNADEELPNIQFADCDTIGLTSRDRCLIIRYMVARWL